MTIWGRVRRALIGAPKDLKAPGALHKLSLIALLAWVGLGADGLSSSAYGPDEAFRQLGEHRGMAVFIALAMVVTVLVISYGYSRIIEQFPSGGGGYLVASKILGGPVGVVSGSALLVDYVLTIAISIAAGADAIFSFLPLGWRNWALPTAVAGIVLLVVMNLRGVKESVTTIAPVFGVFIITHAVLLLVALGGHATEVPAVTREVSANIGQTVAALGVFGTLRLFLHAYSLGGGTYTGIEAVSNGVGIMREPRVETAKKTMVLMAASLAVTAAGLMLCYLLWDARPEAGKTMNAVLLERVAGSWSLAGIDVGWAFVIVALVSEGALLFVAAQAGFVDGPRVMANMAVDSWLPNRFSALSERLTMRNGIMLMGAAALAVLIYTRGDVSKLVVMYSINVFLTFTLSNVSMTVFWVRRRRSEPKWLRRLPAHVVAATLCLVILLVTVTEKFLEGGWLTLLITAALIGFCFAVKRHYRRVARAIRKLDTALPDPNGSLALAPTSTERGERRRPDPRKPVAVLFVGAYGGLGRRALLTLTRMFPGHFQGVIFVSVAVADSDVFKGAAELPALEERTRRSLEQYERFAESLGLACASEYAVGTEVTLEAEKLATRVAGQYPQAMAVAGQIVFEKDSAWNRLLHNETAFLIQRRLQHNGVPMVVLPVQVDLNGRPGDRTSTAPRTSPSTPDAKVRAP
ncbi:MAG: APC family permease [Deltaproteobacteria bacterium]|nr:APC family permease [Deltaproteobacteria bacterium]